jgi:hypothetical protein
MFTAKQSYKKTCFYANFCLKSCLHFRRADCPPNYAPGMRKSPAEPQCGTRQAQKISLKTSGCRIKAITTAFQAVDTGSIPVTRSMKITG